MVGARDADAERVRRDPPFLATSSGFQSAQYREVEFLLGNKNADMVAVFAHDEGARTALDALLREPSLYDEFLAYLARRGYAVPSALLDRDWTQPYRLDEGLVDVFAGVYAQPNEHWGVYETCEELVDLEDNFQQWRFRHLQVVQRTIGQKTGTGGSTGVDFLRRRSTSPSSPSCTRSALASGADDRPRGVDARGRRSGAHTGTGTRHAHLFEARVETVAHEIRHRRRIDARLPAAHETSSQGELVLRRVVGRPLPGRRVLGTTVVARGSVLEPAPRVGSVVARNAHRSYGTSSGGATSRCAGKPAPLIVANCVDRTGNTSFP